MDPKKLDFHINSRKPFAEEAPVMAAVKQARKQIGQLQGSALFRMTSNVAAEPTVIPRALDIIRGGMETAVQKAMHKGYAQGVLDGIQKAAGEVSPQSVLSGIRTAAEKGYGTIEPHSGVSESLRRLGIRK
jgi:hypothetical protein